MPSRSSHLTIGRLRTLPVSRMTSVFRALLCLALAGCSAKDETVTPPQFQTPFVSETSVSVFGNMAVLTATVNANYRSTDCYFEYGQNTSYGMHTVSKSIGAGGSGVVVRDTLRGLPWDSTYHCRCVAVNSAGATVGADKELALLAHPFPFVYPLTVGTRWKYTYEWYSRLPNYITPVRPGTHILGTWVWEVKERTSTDSVRIEVLRTESVARYNQSDTLMTWTTSFIASIGQSYYTVRWFELTILPNYGGDGREGWYGSVITVPRFAEFGIDTVTLGHDNGQSNVAIAHYVNGKGLVSWHFGSGMLTYQRETITLDSVWVAP